MINSVICPTGAAGMKDQSKVTKIDIRGDPFMIGMINFRKKLPKRDITNYLFSPHRYKLKSSIREDPLYSMCMRDSYMVGHIDLLVKIRKFVSDRKNGKILKYKSYTLPKRRLIQRIISAVWRTTEIVRPKHTDEIFVDRVCFVKPKEELDDDLCRLSFNYFMYMNETGKKLPFRKYFLPQFHKIDGFLRTIILSKYTKKDLSDVDEKELLRSGVEPNPGPKYSCDRCGDVYILPFMDVESFYCRSCYPLDRSFYFLRFPVSYGVLRAEERRLRKQNGRYGISCALCGGKLPDIMRYDSDSYKHLMKVAVLKEVFCGRCSRRSVLYISADVNSRDRIELDRLLSIYRGIDSQPKDIDAAYKHSAFRSYLFRRGVNVHLLDRFLPVSRNYLRCVYPFRGGHMFDFNRFLLYLTYTIQIYPHIISMDHYYPSVPILQWRILQEDEIIPFLISLPSNDQLLMQLQKLLLAYQARQLPRA
jgi:hypothetical protein